VQGQKESQGEAPVLRRALSWDGARHDQMRSSPGPILAADWMRCRP